MKAVKILAIVLAVYVGIVALFESMIGYFQPENEGTLVITTTSDGEASDRVLSRLDTDGQVYVAVNHWPRAWYHAALDNPDVKVDLGEGVADYRAVPVEGSEHDRVMAEHPIPGVMRFLMGFAPRYFLRLEPA